jgi:hypothetical protein
VAEQVAVESHLRWCRTCAARVEDLNLIGDGVRLGSPAFALAHDEIRDAIAVQESVLTRIRTERELSFGTRIRDMFTDMRLLWPALGATFSLVIGMAVAGSVLQLASRERPESLAQMIDSLSNPGTEINPLRPGNTARYDHLFDKYLDSNRSGGISLPRVADDSAVFEGISAQEGMFAVAAVVTRDGRITNYELLSSERMNEPEKPVHANDVAAVLDVVRRSRFAPAQTSLGRTVAVNMVWLMVVTTVQTPAAPHSSSVRVVTPVVHPPAAIAPVESLDEPPAKRSGRLVESTTA